MRKRVLDSVDDVIAHFGGPIAMAERFGLHRNAVYNMRYRRRIDPARGLEIEDALPAGLALSRELMRRGTGNRRRP